MYELRNMLVSWINLHLPSMHFNDTFFLFWPKAFSRKLWKSQSKVPIIKSFIYITLTREGIKQRHK